MADCVPSYHIGQLKRERILLSHLCTRLHIFPRNSFRILRLECGLLELIYGSFDQASLYKFLEQAEMVQNGRPIVQRFHSVAQRSNAEQG